ncbi:MAG TPA: type 4a pilus biogenesis protein PilO [Candidatus Nanoarchaeia archaeon]|nr:type 4a pilus biogenesis protein PilO [Candidatus Nanoarchaeia archaeon]
MATSKEATTNKHELSANNFIVVAALVTLVAIIISVVASKALVAQLLLNNRVIDKKSVAAKQLQTNVNNLPELHKNYDALGGYQQLISDSLPSKPDFPALVSTLDVIAGSSGVKLRTISPDTNAPAVDATATTGSSPVAVPFSLGVEGSYDAMLRFFTNIELSSRPIRVTGISQQGPNGSQQMLLDLSSYYQPPADLSLKTETVQ